MQRWVHLFFLFLFSIGKEMDAYKRETGVIYKHECFLFEEGVDDGAVYVQRYFLYRNCICVI